MSEHKPSPTGDAFTQRYDAFMRAVRRRAWLLAFLMTALGILMWWPLMKTPKIVAVLIVGVPSYFVFFAILRTAPRWGSLFLGRRRT